MRCRECDQPITTARMAAIPGVTLCCACQTGMDAGDRLIALMARDLSGSIFDIAARRTVRRAERWATATTPGDAALYHADRLE